MNVLKKIANSFGYSLTRKHKTDSLKELLSLRLKYNPCDYLIDVGSNIGDFCDEYSEMFSKSFCFEPNKELFLGLKKKFSKKNNIIINELGVGDTNEKKKFYVTNDKGKTLSSIKKQSENMSELLRNTEVVDNYEIEIVKLYDYIIKEKLINNTFFLKTDTQGNDIEVLYGLKEFIKKVKFIKIEMPVINIYEINYKFEQINDFMKKNLYKPLYIQHLTRSKKGELVEYDTVFEKIENS